MRPPNAPRPATGLSPAADHPAELIRTGVALAQQGRVADALPLFERAVALTPTHAQARLNFGAALAASGRPADAETQLREALRLDPKYPDAHFNLGNVLRDAGRPAEAIDHFRTAVRLKPDHTGALSNLGLALSDAGRHAEAVPRRLTEYGYNVENEQTTVTDALGVSTTLYDKDQNTTETIDPLGRTSQTVFNKDDEAIEQIDGANDITASCNDEPRTVSTWSFDMYRLVLVFLGFASLTSLVAAPVPKIDCKQPLLYLPIKDGTKWVYEHEGGKESTEEITAVEKKPKEQAWIVAVSQVRARAPTGSCSLTCVTTTGEPAPAAPRRFT